MRQWATDRPFTQAQISKAQNIDKLDALPPILTYLINSLNL